METFAVLQSASDELIESVLDRVDRAAMARALQGASARLIERVLGGRPSEAVEDVLSNIRSQQAASLAEIDQARRQVADLVDELAAAGIPA